MEKLSPVSFYSHQNLKPKQEERRLFSKAPRSKRAPKNIYKSFVLYTASANPKWFCFLRISQIDTVIWSERDQPINQNRKQLFTQSLKFSLCWVFFIHISKELVLCLSVSLHILQAFIIGHKAPITYPCCWYNSISKDSRKQESKDFVTKKTLPSIWCSWRVFYLMTGSAKPWWVLSIASPQVAKPTCHVLQKN